MANDDAWAEYKKEIADAGGTGLAIDEQENDNEYNTEEYDEVGAEQGDEYSGQEYTNQFGDDDEEKNEKQQQGQIQDVEERRRRAEANLAQMIKLYGQPSHVYTDKDGIPYDAEFSNRDVNTGSAKAADGEGNLQKGLDMGNGDNATWLMKNWELVYSKPLTIELCLRANTMAAAAVVKLNAYIYLITIVKFKFARNPIGALVEIANNEGILSMAATALLTYITTVDKDCEAAVGRLRVKANQLLKSKQNGYMYRGMK